jgi:hypothetical protein
MIFFMNINLGVYDFRQAVSRAAGHDRKDHGHEYHRQHEHHEVCVHAASAFNIQ